jgi:hypothetical protein
MNENIFKCREVHGRIVTGSGSNDWIYWCCFTIKLNYSNLQQLTIGDCLRLVPFSSFWTTSVLHSTVAG